MSRSAIERRAELKRFMGADLDKLVEQAEKQERDRMCARSIHYAVLRQRATSSLVDISGR